jgi:molecular chaperone DnaK (HSP70)
MAAGAAPMTALRAASIEHADPSSRTAQLILAFARDFDREHGTSVATEHAALERIADKYLSAIVELRAVNESNIDCPFLATTATGPKHLEKRVTVEILQHMLAGIVEIVPT